MSQQMAAAFFDLDGTLVSGDLMSQLFAHIGANAAPIGPAPREATRPGEKGRSTTVGWRRLAEQGPSPGSWCKTTTNFNLFLDFRGLLL
jgi:FMN phosphatase YigB (HAD superfamily)